MRLMLQIPLMSVDVNVHPNKLEVRSRLNSPFASPPRTFSRRPSRAKPCPQPRAGIADAGVLYVVEEKQTEVVQIKTEVVNEQTEVESGSLPEPRFVKYQSRAADFLVPENGEHDAPPQSRPSPSGWPCARHTRRRSRSSS